MSQMNFSGRNHRRVAPRANLRLETLEDRTVPAYLATLTAFENLDLLSTDSDVVPLLGNIDDFSAALNIGANTFTYYGTSYTGMELFAGSNGYVTFGAGQSAYTNDVLTSATAFPEPTIAALWDDWDNRNDPNSLVLYAVRGNRLIVEWSQVQHYPISPGTVTFQAILQLNTGAGNGSITFNYVDLDTGDSSYDDGISATIGIKAAGVNNTGGDVVAISFDNATFTSGTAVIIDDLPPVADAGPDYTVDEGSSFTLDSSGSTPDDGTFAYEWDFDYDGVTFDTDSTIADPLFSAAFLNPQVRTVALRISDGSGYTSPIDTATVTVLDVLPSIVTAGNGSLLEGSDYALTLGAITNPNRAVTSIIVNWGDGLTSTFATNGLKIHRYADGAATYAITVDLVDQDGLHTNTAPPRSVQVSNVAPTVVVSGGPSVFEGSLSAITLGTVTDPGQDTISSFVVRWGDGTSTGYAGNGVKTHVYAAPGTYTVRVDLIDEDGIFTNRSTATTLTVTAIPVILPAPPLTVAGVGGDVIVYNADGSPRFGFRPYEGYAGNVAVAVGDVTGDGIDDIVTGTETTSSHVKVFDGVTGDLLASFLAYEGFTGGVSVAVGDVLGTGRAQIVTGAGPGGGPHVKVFDLASGGVAEAVSFFAYDAGFRGGVTVAAGRLDASGHDLIVTGAGTGGQSHVKTFDVARRVDVETRSFFAYDAGFRGGVNVAAGDGYIATGAGNGGGAHVKLFDYATGATAQSFIAYSPSAGGVRVALTERAGIPVIETGSGPVTAPTLRVFRRSDLILLDGFYIGNVAFDGGIYVG